MIEVESCEISFASIWLCSYYKNNYALCLFVLLLSCPVHFLTLGLCTRSFRGAPMLFFFYFSFWSPDAYKKTSRLNSRVETGYLWELG